MASRIKYVTLLPSGRGFGKAVEGQVDSAIGKSEKKTDGFFSKVGKGLKVVGGAVAGVVAAVGAIAITGGISRALNIEDAQAKLKGLGHDTKAIESIMNDALASVKGTAFGLDTAATVASTAVAAGIKPGKELEKYLRLTADAATIAGVSMDDMGSIMNKMTTSGKVYTQELNQLADKGLPVFQWLQDEYGVTAEELRKMVSAGEIDAERFRKVMEEKIGGAALASGDTTRGAFANMRAALSRLGLAFVGDGLTGAKTFFQEVTVIFDGLTDRVGPWVEKFQGKLGEMFQIEGMGENFLDWLDETVEKVASGPIPQLLSALQPLLPVLAEMAGLVGSALGDAFFELGEALAPVLPILAESLTEAIVELIPPLTDLFLALIPLIPPLAELLVAITPLVVLLVEKLLPVLEWFIDLVTDSANSTGLFADVMKGDLGFWSFINGLLSMAGPFGDFLRRVFEITTAVTNWAISVRDSVDDAVNNIKALPGKVRGALANAGTWLVQTGKDIINGLINGVESMITDAVNAVKNVGGAMLEGVQSFLGIKSPSRVFRDQVGKMVGLGLLDGIEDSSINGRIDSAVRHLVEVPGVAVVSGADAGGSSVFHLYDTDGTLMATFKGMLDGALAPLSRGSMRRDGGF